MSEEKMLPSPTERSMQLNTIQALRFVAAFAVVFLHSTFYTAERLDDSLGLYTLGANGVRLFFVISGFVMIVSSGGMAKAERGWSVFAVRRVIRIVPLYWAVTTVKLLVLLLAPAVVLHAEVDWVYIVKSYLFYPAMNVDGQIHPLLGVGWTLNFEMFFYFLFCMALLLRVEVMKFVCPILISLALLSLARSEIWPDAMQFWCDPIVLDFLAGMAVARLWQSGNLPNGFVSIFLLFLGLAYLFLPVPHPDHGSLLSSLLSSLLYTVAASMVVIGAIALEGRIGPVVPKWVMFFGASSYALYLVHPIVAPAVPQLLERFGLVWPHVSIAFSLCVALAAGSLCHVLVEMPLTKWMTLSARRSGLLDGVAKG